MTISRCQVATKRQLAQNYKEYMHIPGEKEHIHCADRFTCTATPPGKFKKFKALDPMGQLQKYVQLLILANVFTRSIRTLEPGDHNIRISSYVFPKGASAAASDALRSGQRTFRTHLEPCIVQPVYLSTKACFFAGQFTPTKHAFTLHCPCQGIHQLFLEEDHFYI